MNYHTNFNEFLSIAEIDSKDKSAIFDIDVAELTMIWNRGSTMQINIDQKCYEISKNAIFFLNSFHKIECVDLISARMLKFSKSFLCSSDKTDTNDLKTLCDFSRGQLQIITISEDQLSHLESAWAFFCNEINSKDVLQKDILSLLLKRILRLCFKTEDFNILKTQEPDVISSFNLLVEDHFFEHHDVAFYASKLNKSPKALSMLFSLLIGCPPKNFIHDRIMVAAKNQIQYTNKSIKIIAYELGYEDIQTFSRFFKNKEGISPLFYRKKIQLQMMSVAGHQFSA